MLRIFLEGRAKTLGKNSHWLLDADRRVHIDLGVLRGFLKIPKYYNGARSMTSLVEVSTLSSGKGFSRASLPSKQIVDMYAPAHEFFQLVNLAENQEPLFLPARETLARLVHEQYCRRNPSSDTAIPWDQLEEGLREQNRQQVDYYMAHLKTIGYEVELSELVDQSYKFTKKDIEKLAELEHERWCRIKRMQGWSCGNKKDEHDKTHPDLLEWEELCRKRPKETRKDMDAMADIPMMLKRVGLSIIRDLKGYAIKP
jgi:hypothetical protein